MKILLLDIENTPNLAYVWGKWEQNVIEFEKEWQLLSFSFKWLGEDKPRCYSQRNYSERQLVQKLKKLLHVADVVIAHNGDEFDLKKIRAKMVEHDILPPSQFRSIDTLKIAKKYFKFNSNKLDDLGRTLHVGRKVKTGGFDLWLQCMAGSKAAFHKMERYNNQDVELLERVYLKLRPWIQGQPGLSIAEHYDQCQVCASKKTRSDGIRHLNGKAYRRLSCGKCGARRKGKI